jgi:Bacterial antitoxin of type II TA system, VapB
LSGGKEATDGDEPGARRRAHRGSSPRGGHKTKKAAVTAALTEYVRSRRRRQILKWRGQVDYFHDYDYKALRGRRA